MSYNPVRGNKISEVGANSSSTLLGAGGTFTGTWEDVRDYTTIAVTILTGNVTDGTLYMDLSMDGGTTFVTIPFTVNDSTFNLPRIINRAESHFRVRYVNGTTAQTGFFNIQTSYNNGGTLSLNYNVAGVINAENDVTLVKSVIAGEVEDASGGVTGQYDNVHITSQRAMKTSITPDILYEATRPTDPVIPTGAGITIDPVLNAEANVLDSGWMPATQYGGGSLINVISDTTLSVYVMNASDELGNNLIGDSTPTIVSNPGVPAATGAAFFDNYVRIVIVNTSGSSATEYAIRLVGNQVPAPPVFTSLDQQVFDFYPAPLTRSVSVGRDSNNVYTNTPSPGVNLANSTQALLGIGATFTGDWVNVSSYGEIKVTTNTDVPGDCFLQLSHDGVTVDTSLNLPPQFTEGPNDYRFIHSINPSIPYFRVVYTNGSVAQTIFKLSTLFLVSSGDGFVSRATQVLDRYTDVKNLRVVNNPTEDRNFGLVNYQVQKRKFGYNSTVASTAFETVWAGAALGGTLNYVFPQSAETVRIKAGGNINDTSGGTGARSVTVYGLDNNWNEVEETIVTNGASASDATTTFFFRVNRVEVTTSGTYGGSNLGIIKVEQTTSLIEMAYIDIGIGVTQQTVYTVPANKTMFISKIKASVGDENSADIRLFHIDYVDDITAPFTSVKRYEWGLEDYRGASTFRFDSYLKFKEKNDIIVDSKRITGPGTARVSVDLDFILVNNNI